MKTTINNYQFHRAFEQIRPNNFSYVGLNALFDYLEQYEKDCGEELELDVDALCCDFTEYENLEEYQNAYNAEDYETIEDIEYCTTVIRVGDDGFIIQNF